LLGVDVAARQWKTASDPRKSLEVARKLLLAKLRSLGLSSLDTRAFREEITEAQVLSDLMVAEARSAAAYHMRFRGARIDFKDNAPDRWHVFVARSGTLLRGRGGVSRARHASTPWGCSLNYGLAIGLGQCSRALTVGLI
jgi:hypothetical protein